MLQFQNYSLFLVNLLGQILILQSQLYKLLRLFISLRFNFLIQLSELFQQLISLFLNPQKGLFIIKGRLKFRTNRFSLRGGKVFQLFLQFTDFLIFDLNLSNFEIQQLNHLRLINIFGISALIFEMGLLQQLQLHLQVINLLSELIILLPDFYQKMLIIIILLTQLLVLQRQITRYLLQVLIFMTQLTQRVLMSHLHFSLLVRQVVALTLQLENVVLRFESRLHFAIHLIHQGVIFRSIVRIRHNIRVFVFPGLGTHLYLTISSSCNGVCLLHKSDQQIIYYYPLT